MTAAVAIRAHRKKATSRIRDQRADLLSVSASLEAPWLSGGRRGLRSEDACEGNHISALRGIMPSRLTIFSLRI